MDVAGELGRFLTELDRHGLVALALKLALVLFVTLVALRFAGVAVRTALRHLFAREAREGTAAELNAVEVERRRRTLEDLFGGVLRVGIIVIGFLMALQAVDLDIGPAIAGLGIAGLALSLGAQHLVRDYMAGAFILIENQYAKGDTITVADRTGTVEDISLRRTTLRDLDGTMHTVPHGLVGVSSNLTRVWARINVDVTIPLGTEAEDAAAVVDRAIAAVDTAGREMAEDEAWRRRILEAPRVDRVEALGPAGATLKILGSVRAVDRWTASSELRKRVLVALSREGIRPG
jgi:moderate conductance mechanosensitive channel